MDDKTALDTATSLQRAFAAVDLCANGQFIRSALETVGLSRSCFYKLKNSNPLLEDRYRCARESLADQFADEVVAIADSEPDPMKGRLRMDARRWVASVYNRSVYGDKVDLNVNRGVDLAAVLTEVQARRLRLHCDPSAIENAEIVEKPKQCQPQSPDHLSVDNPPVENS